MEESGAVLVGRSRMVSENVYFMNESGDRVHPIFQADDSTGQRSYRVYIDGGNEKTKDIDVTSEQELIKHAQLGHSIRCLLPSGQASNRSLYSSDIIDLIVSTKVLTKKFWWVNHKQTYRSEIEGGYVWSPKANSNGARNQTYLNLTLVRSGDIVFSYAGAEIRAIGVVTAGYQEQPKPEEFGSAGGNWSADGWLVPVEWIVLDKPITPKSHLAAIAPLLPSKNSPLQSNGNGNQSCYLASISVALGALVLDLSRQDSPDSIDRLQELEDHSLEDVQQIAIELDQSISPTEREQLTRARVGQGLFRQRVQLIEKGCRLTGITDTRFLVASHIKPWKSGDNSERLDGHNGLLLAPHADKLFDRGWMSFEDNGDVLVERSARVVISSWGLGGVTNVGTFTQEQQFFLRYHRARVFKG